MTTESEFFQCLFDQMNSIKKLPKKAFPGDLAKTEDGTAWVFYTDKWIKLDDGMKLVFNIQQGDK